MVVGSDAGLTLCAATVDGSSAEPARAFAQRFLDSELVRYQAQHQTMTVDAAAIAASTEIDNQWQAPDGMCCTALLVSGWLDQAFCIVGVAMLKGSNLPMSVLTETAAALTKYLARVDVANSALISL
jgi:hypothetical protein